ncbi:hypothetical protein Taro_049569 [Colocasia esculenta]|uniref:Uncharacterized protein n=1 Tax=Colocasia esculenta TaxID=4460 RepID=A0A843XBD8_COLES|nr:hypothetical protein [Colocasia esculenta]
MTAATSSQRSYALRQVFTVSASYCTRGTSANFLVRSYTGRSLGARHLRACPVKEIVTIAWDRPRTPIEGVLRAAGVLESRTLEQRGKWWLGQRH